MKRDDDDLHRSPEDARFVAKLASLYRPPTRTDADRARFDARLEERLARGAARRPWLLPGAAAAAAAAAALVLALVPNGETRPPAGRTAADARPALVEPGASTEETLLLIANGPLADRDEALPEDYRMIASLLE
jgi:hypothetical protein